MAHVYHYTVSIPGTATLDRVDEVVEWLRTVARVVRSPMVSERKIIVTQVIEDWRNSDLYPALATIPTEALTANADMRSAFRSGVDWAFVQLARRDAKQRVRDAIEKDGWIVSDWEEGLDDGDQL